MAPQPAGQSCTGYVHFPAVAAVGVGTVLAAPVGAQLTAVLPARRLRQLFALILIAGTIGSFATSIFSFITAWNEFMFAVNLTSVDAATAMPARVCVCMTQ